MLIYQPQVENWDGDLIDLRPAVAIKAAGSEAETFGAISRIRMRGPHNNSRASVPPDLHHT